LVAAAAALAIVTAACAPAAPPPAQPPAAPAAKPAQFSPQLQQVIDAANREGTLTLLWLTGRFGGDVGIRAMVDAMNRRYGTNIQLQYTPGPDFPTSLNRLIEEHRAGQVASSDVYMGTANHISNGTQAGMLMEVDYSSFMERPEPSGADIKRVTTLGTAVAMVSRIVGITYNTNLVRGEDVPRSMEDVFKPKWQGKLASTPFATGLFQFAADDVLGYEYMKDYTTRLARKVGGLITCNDVDRIASGEFAMLIFDCGHDDALRFQARGAPVGHAVVSEVARINIIYFGVPKHARNPNAAKLFINFMHTEEGQRLAWEHGGHDLHIYPESKSRELMQAVYKSHGKLYLDTVERELELGTERINQIRNEFVAILRAGGR
jgi:ABC-type Fe3+ transport system substrate-binding protein